jgi:hypothetical protein
MSKLFPESCCTVTSTACIHPSSAMADNTPLSTSDPPKDQSFTQQPSHMHRTRSREMVDDAHHQIVDEDPLLISQTLTYVTDDGSVLHSFQSAPFSFGESISFLYSSTVMDLFVASNLIYDCSC